MSEEIVEPGPGDIDPVFGVTVNDVLALAPHVDVSAELPATTDATFGNGSARKVRTGDVAQWIRDVAAVVSIRLRNRALITDPDQQATLMSAAKSVVKVGAAAYLIDAAYPLRAGVNDSTSYGQVLWTRYANELNELVLMLDEWLTPDPIPGVATGGIAGSFPPPIFLDDLRW